MQILFVAIYFVNMGSSFALTYDSVIMFSLYRYLNIDYPENLQFFFEATDSFKMDLNLISSASPEQQQQ